MQKILLDENQKYDDILIFSTEEILHNKRNMKRGHFMVNKNASFPGTLKPLVISTNLILNILRGNYPLMNSIDFDTNILIYICGHGGDAFIKVLDREYILCKDITNALCTLSLKANKVLVILDTCQAESIVDCTKLPLNVFVVFSSKRGEPSVSHAVSHLVGCNVIDGFMQVFFEKFQKEMWLEDFFKLFTYEDVGSTVRFYGEKRSFKLNEFVNNEELNGDRNYSL